MSCCVNSVEQQTRAATLVFKRAELLYDAKNYSFVEGDIMTAGDEHVRHQVQDIGESGNVDRVTRILNLAHAECVEMLYPYTKEELQEELDELDDILKESDEYRIELTLPATFSLTTVKLLEHLLHEYMVCRVLADWMSITNPSSQANWETKLKSQKDKIQTSLVSRTGKLRRKCKPF